MNYGERFRSARTFTSEYFKILSPEFPEFLQEYIDTPAMQRIDKISMSCGCNYSRLYKLKFMMSNLQHSIGVALIIWHFTGDKKATLAGLFHDIATPCFKHCVDFLRGDSEKQEATEDRTEQIIRNSEEIMRLLKRDGIEVEEVSDYHIYPVADNDMPQMSADRLEYTLSNGVFFKPVWGKGRRAMEKIREIYADMTVRDNESGAPEMCFRTALVAEDFVLRARELWPLWFDSRDKLLMQFIADTLKMMKDEGMMDEEDLYRFSERQILNRIRRCGNARITTAWRKFQEATEVYESDAEMEGVYCRKIKTKRRWINPLVAAGDSSGVARITEISKKADEAIESWMVYETPDWAYFGFGV